VAERTESQHESCSKCRGRVPGHQPDIRQYFSERRRLSPQTCEWRVSLVSCGQRYRHFQTFGKMLDLLDTWRVSKNNARMLVRERGWSSRAYETWLGDTLVATLFRE
jgi:hypothetical protein